MNPLAVPVVEMEGYFSKFIIFPEATPSKKDANMVAIGKYLKTPTRKNFNCWLYFTFGCRGFADNSCLSL